MRSRDLTPHLGEVFAEHTSEDADGVRWRCRWVRVAPPDDVPVTSFWTARWMGRQHTCGDWETISIGPELPYHEQAYPENLCTCDTSDTDKD